NGERRLARWLTGGRGARLPLEHPYPGVLSGRRASECPGAAQTATYDAYPLTGAARWPTLHGLWHHGTGPAGSVDLAIFSQCGGLLDVAAEGDRVHQV